MVWVNDLESERNTLSCMYLPLRTTPHLRNTLSWRTQPIQCQRIPHKLLDCSRI